jgi:glycosyltransferase involved in cell wall biosynthesis
VPSIASDVGGITTAVRDRVNGRTFPATAPVRQYRDYVLDRFSSPEYRQLCWSSFRETSARLNWRVAGEALHSLLREAAGTPS